MFFNKAFDEIKLFHLTSCAEQIMTTGGGYQDAIGAIDTGFRLIHFTPGILPSIYCEPIHITAKTKTELQKRVMFVYSGQTRVAKNLLSSIMENYVNNDISTIHTLKSIGDIAVEMKNNLIANDLNAFSKNMIKSFKLNTILNPHFSNSSINTILDFFFNYSDGYMLSGAGNGGFLTILLKENVIKNDIMHLFNSKFSTSTSKIYDFNLLL